MSSHSTAHSRWQSLARNLLLVAIQRGLGPIQQGLCCTMVQADGVRKRVNGRQLLAGLVGMHKARIMLLCCCMQKIVWCCCM